MIDLTSDTVTCPTPPMRAAIASAPVGDEQRNADPTTTRLEARCAELLNKERCIFLPSATMANAIAIQLHCGPGQELLAAENSHVLCYEGGGAAVHARCSVRSIPTWNGIFAANAVRERIRESSYHAPQVRLVCVENTTNLGGGRPWPVDQLDGLVDACRELGLRLHLDGARLANAAVALEQPLARLVGGFDTVTMCFSKGLGCPMGAVLALPQDHYEEARRIKQRMGGSLRQSGMMAAAALYALEHHIERLRDDHRRAQRLYDGLSNIEGLVVEAVPVRTNMVFFQIGDRFCPDAFANSLARHQVGISRVARRRFRAVTHLDLTDADVEQAVRSLEQICSELKPAR